MNGLPDSICTPQDLTVLILEIKEYMKWYEHESIKQKTGAKNSSTQPTLSPGTTQFLRNIGTNGLLQTKQLDTIIVALEKYKQVAPVANITLAAPAPEGLKKEITAWCRAELNAAILVSFDFNRTLLGGMVLRYGSHVHDWSFRHTILTTPVSFSEVLSRV